MIDNDNFSVLTTFSKNINLVYNVTAGHDGITGSDL
jgi:hypothetical protein